MDRTAGDDKKYGIGGSAPQEGQAGAALIRSGATLVEARPAHSVSNSLHQTYRYISKRLVIGIDDVSYCQ